MGLDAQLNNYLEKIQQNKNVNPTNKKLITQYFNTQKAQDKSTRTMYKQAYCLLKLLEAFPKNLSFDKATKQQIEGVVSKVNALDLADATKCNIRITLKQLYKETLGEGEYYPRQVAWIKTTLDRKAKQPPVDILSKEEVQQMLKFATNPRDKALIALLYDSGIRAGELLNMKKKDINLRSDPAHIVVDGKTGMRQVPIVFSVPYLSTYLNGVENTIANDESIWRNRARSHIRGSLDEAGLSKMLKEVAQAAGITKRVYPHLFRHSRATFYANKLTEQQLKAYFGWTKDSSMASTYVHMSGRDIDGAILSANGVVKSKKAEEVVSEIRTCPKCNTENEVTSVYCKTCGSALDMQVAMNDQENNELVRQLVKTLKEQKILVSPKMREDILKGVEMKRITKNEVEKTLKKLGEFSTSIDVAKAMGVKQEWKQVGRCLEELSGEKKLLKINMPLALYRIRMVTNEI